MRFAHVVGVLAVLTVTVFTAACTTVTEVGGQQVPNPGTNPPSEAEMRKRADIRLQLAASYYQKGQYSVAREEAQRALQMDPSYAPAYGMLALISMDVGDRADADANFTRALRLDADNPELNNNYGWFLCQSGRERDALAYFNKASQNRVYATPGMPLRNAGVCLMQLRDYVGAEDYLRRSFQIDAQSPLTKFHLARLYLLRKDMARAKFYYGLLEKSVDANPETVWLGLRIARADGDTRLERQLADDLLRRYSGSREAGLLRRGAFDE